MSEIWTHQNSDFRQVRISDIYFKCLKSKLSYTYLVFRHVKCWNLNFLTLLSNTHLESEHFCLDFRHIRTVSENRTNASSDFTFTLLFYYNTSLAQNIITIAQANPGHILKIFLSFSGQHSRTREGQVAVSFVWQEVQGSRLCPKTHLQQTCWKSWGGKI